MLKFLGLLLRLPFLAIGSIATTALAILIIGFLLSIFVLTLSFAVPFIIFAFIAIANGFIFIRSLD